MSQLISSGSIPSLKSSQAVALTYNPGPYQKPKMSRVLILSYQDLLSCEDARGSAEGGQGSQSPLTGVS